MSVSGTAGAEVRSSAVLVVEDDPDIRGLLAQVLQLEGYQVSTAAHGLEALAVMAGAPPCLILLDLMMPVMDGLEFLRRQHADERIAPIPVVVVSAYRTLVPHGIEVVAKPVDLDLLLAAVARHCGPAPG